MFSGNADISLNVAALAVSALSSFIVEDLVKGPRTPMLSSKETKSSWLQWGLGVCQSRGNSVWIFKISTFCRNVHIIGVLYNVKKNMLRYK